MKFRAADPGGAPRHRFSETLIKFTARRCFRLEWRQSGEVAQAGHGHASGGARVKGGRGRGAPCWAAAPRDTPSPPDLGPNQGMGWDVPLQSGGQPSHCRDGKGGPFNSLIKLTKGQGHLGASREGSQQQGPQPVPALPSLLGCPSGAALGLQMLQGLGRPGPPGRGDPGCRLLPTRSPKGEVSSSDTMKPGQAMAMFPSAHPAWIALHRWHSAIQRSRCFALGLGEFMSGCGCGRGSLGKDRFHPKLQKKPKSLQEPFPLIAPLLMQGGLR